jgi:predicted secreted Zn-dependent protease
MAVGMAHAEPVTRIGSSYYYVEGGSALVLTAQMENKGPADPNGRHHIAYTKWSVQWRFRHNMSDGVCKMEKVSVLVGVTSIRPRWRDEKKGTAALRERWKQMDEAIDRNEAHHKQEALDAGKQIEDALNNLQPTATCEELTDLANKVASGILEQHKKASYEYDHSNDYGRKNGVTLM